MIECRLLRFILVWAVVLARYDKQSHLFDRGRRSRGSPHLIFYAFSYQTISQHWQQPENPAKHFLPIFAFPPSDSVAAYLFIFYFRHIKYLFTFLAEREGERGRERERETEKETVFFCKILKRHEQMFCECRKLVLAKNIRAVKPSAIFEVCDFLTFLKVCMLCRPN